MCWIHVSSFERAKGILDYMWVCEAVCLCFHFYSCVCVYSWWNKPDASDFIAWFMVVRGYIITIWCCSLNTWRQTETKNTNSKQQIHSWGAKNIHASACVRDPLCCLLFCSFFFGCSGRVRHDHEVPKIDKSGVRLFWRSNQWWFLPFNLQQPIYPQTSLTAENCIHNSLPLNCICLLHLFLSTKITSFHSCTSSNFLLALFPISLIPPTVCIFFPSLVSYPLLVIHHPPSLNLTAIIVPS